MDKESQPPQGLMAAAEKPGATGSVSADGATSDGKVHEFNEQTNYVPKRTIITVGCTRFAAPETRD